MKKSLLVSAVSSVLLVMFLISPISVSAQAAGSSLTPEQVQSILSLLQSFGANQNIVNNVSASLSGGTPSIPATGSATLPAFCYTFNNDIGTGRVNSETDVLNLQSALKREGFLQGQQSAVTTFNEVVADAVTRFQQKYSLVQPSGYVNVATRTKLNAIYGCPTSTTPVPPVLPQQSIASTTSGGVLLPLLPTYSYVPVPTYSLNQGSNILYRYKVIAPTAGPVYVNSESFSFTTPGVNLNNLSLEVFTDSGFSQSVAGLQTPPVFAIASQTLGPASSNNVVTFVRTESIVIPAGASRYFQIRGNATFASTPQTVRVSHSSLPQIVLANTMPVAGQNDSTVQPSITILSPNGGESYSNRAGNEIAFRWSSNGGEQVSAFLVFPDRTTCYMGQTNASVGTLSFFPWNPSGGFPCNGNTRRVIPGQYKLGLYLHSNSMVFNPISTGLNVDLNYFPQNVGLAYDMSDNWFTIVSSTASTATTTPPVQATLSALLSDAASDQAGTWGVFGPGAGRANSGSVYDWHFTASLSLPSAKTLIYVDVIGNDGSSGWSTRSGATNALRKELYPLVSTSAPFVTTTANQTANLPAGVTNFNFYGQPEQASGSTFSGGRLIIGFTDGSTITTTIPANSAIRIPSSVTSSGSVQVNLDASTPASRNVNGGSVEVPATVLKFRTGSEAIRLLSIGLRFDGSNLGALTKFTVWDGDTIVGFGVFIGSQRTTKVMLSSPVTIDANTDKRLTIKVDLSQVDITSPARAGDTVAINYDGANSQSTSATIISSGQLIYSSTTASTGAGTITLANSRDSLQEASYMPIPIPSDSLSPGQNALIRFKVVAPASNSVSFAGNVFPISTQGINLSGITLDAFIDPGFSQAVASLAVPPVFASSPTTLSAANSNASISLVRSVPLVIPPGQTVYYQVRGTVSFGSSPQLITTTLNLADNPYSQTISNNVPVTPPVAATPTVVSLPLPTQNLTTGLNTLYRYKITAPTSGDASIGSESVGISTTGVVLDGLNLEVFVDPGFSQPALNGTTVFGSSVEVFDGSRPIGQVAFNRTSALVIPAGQTRYFQAVGLVESLISSPQIISTTYQGLGASNLSGATPIVVTPPVATSTPLTVSSAEIVGNQTAYSPGQTISFSVRGVTSDGSVAVESKGFYSQAWMQTTDPVETVSVGGVPQSVNGVFNSSNNSWAATLTAPSDSSKTYRIEASLYCSNSQAGCATGQIIKSFNFTVTPPVVPDSGILSFVDASSDKVGIWGVFVPGTGRVNGNNPYDYHWRATVTLGTAKTVRCLTMNSYDGWQGWSSCGNSFYPLGVNTATGFTNTGYNQNFGLTAGANTLDLYGQPESTSNFPGSRLNISFTDGSYLNLNVGSSSITPPATPPSSSQGAAVGSLDDSLLWRLVEYLSPIR